MLILHVPSECPFKTKTSPTKRAAVSVCPFWTYSRKNDVHPCGSWCSGCTLQQTGHRASVPQIGFHFNRLTNTLRPRQNGRHFADDIFLNENVWILVKLSLKFVPKDPVNTIPALVQIMAWRRPGDKPLFEPMMVRLLTHICVTLPQWVKLQLWISLRWVSARLQYLQCVCSGDTAVLH